MQLLFVKGTETTDRYIQTENIYMIRKEVHCVNKHFQEVLDLLWSWRLALWLFYETELQAKTDSKFW